MPIYDLLISTVLTPSSAKAVCKENIQKKRESNTLILFYPDSNVCIIIQWWGFWGEVLKYRGQVHASHITIRWNKSFRVFLRQHVHVKPFSKSCREKVESRSVRHILSFVSLEYCHRSSSIQIPEHVCPCVHSKEIIIQSKYITFLLKDKVLHSQLQWRFFPLCLRPVDYGRSERLAGWQADGALLRWLAR